MLYLRGHVVCFWPFLPGGDPGSPRRHHPRRRPRRAKTQLAYINYNHSYGGKMLGAVGERSTQGSRYLLASCYFWPEGPARRHHLVRRRVRHREAGNQPGSRLGDPAGSQSRPGCSSPGRWRWLGAGGGAGVLLGGRR